ncbi:hypothetical protein GCM10009677_36880 [Sphaerisporangium rubeum]|uniref:Molybdopterin-guanine dinucleotide biosynthesis protein A n=1 Tax=Sphaerisporangium rubeum TaxID=321317 RepID=A0A7X0M6K0_9ACTN|nr:molybdenum cofactor guanylyltransferase [Sphaerisporangium rubeum]MBB6473555.1 molybdopterin-guanine dinucleotide biosynthesis protein A [Sphaerisporangium rubeum]
MRRTPAGGKAGPLRGTSADDEAEPMRRTAADVEAGPVRGTSAGRGPQPRKRHDAVILAGGAASRLGGADKPAARVGDRTLIGHVASAVPHAAHLVVVGPPRPASGLGPGRAVFVQESPPGGGPVPALRAGLAAVTAPWVALLAADLPFLRPEHVAGLLSAAGEAAGAVLVDDEGREQWLTGVWRTGTLRESLRAYEGRSLRGLLSPLHPVCLTLPVGDSALPPWFDCDTPSDLAAARRHHGGPDERAG